MKQFQQKFILRLLEDGINTSLDIELNHQGKRLKNYVFERGGNTKKILEDIVNRNWGQCYVYAQNENNDIKYIPLTDEDFYNQLYYIILTTINIQIHT